MRDKRIERESDSWSVLAGHWSEPKHDVFRGFQTPVVCVDEKNPCYGLCMSVKNLAGQLSPRVYQSMSKRLDKFLRDNKWNGAYLWGLDDDGAAKRHEQCLAFAKECLGQY